MATSINEILHQQHKAALGQFLTPPPVADFMGSLFEARWDNVTLLDAGAGEGALAAAFVRSLCAREHKPRRTRVTAYEIDPLLATRLRSTLSSCQHECEGAGINFSFEVINQDFILAAVEMIRGGLFAPQTRLFNSAIVNPPYRKVRADSSTRALLRQVGIETSNLYTGFVALITRILCKRGELVAITPRSFCNGPYFRPFRSDFLNIMSLRRLHVFESRSAAFSHDSVLQENVIVHAVKSDQEPAKVLISSSSGEPGAPASKRLVDYEDVVSAGDFEQFIHLPTHDGHQEASLFMGSFHNSLGDLGLTISTGRVVDFRAKHYLRSVADTHTVPLIYPCHFHAGFIEWPKHNSRKPNAIISNEATKELLVPSGVYVVVKRFTSKEERRRIVACIFDPNLVPCPFVGFENHLNYFHHAGSGMSMTLAKGLAAFLNSTLVDLFFRQFSGHTQVNATDLRTLRYPSRKTLESVGAAVEKQDGSKEMSQEKLDSLVRKELF
jgi:adenine-specific DNA-methyltransferase